MGQPDQFAKRTFALETERITHGAVAWTDAPEIRQALDDFGRWVAPRRPLSWVLDMVQSTAMSSPAGKEVLRSLVAKNPKANAKQLMIIDVMLESMTDAEAEEVVEQVGEVLGARAALRRVLAARKLPLSPEDHAKIRACKDLATLERWLDQAVVAASADEALR